MPARKGSKSLVLKNSYLGKFQCNKKFINTMEQKLDKQEKLLLQQQIEVHDNEEKLRSISEKLENQRRAISHKKKT